MSDSFEQSLELSQARGDSLQRCEGEDDERRPLRVLVVDDSPVIRGLVARMMAERAWCVDTAENGDEAVRMTAVRRYDLVIIDCNMPVMSGPDAVQIIRARDARRAWIVSCTDECGEDNRRRCLAAGADDFVPKPLTWARLEYILATATSDPDPPTAH
ncbi:response regulator [Haliangium ochraceum]|uniref:response regulator n=1 Tax=Haliangium ochraceum TaxID=80816 RepID=UPI00019B9596|nr:response regulator [Haliangium ochraceum]